MQFLPLIFLGLIIFFSVTSAKARRQQQEAIRRAAEARQANEAEQIKAAQTPQQKPPAYAQQAKPVYAQEQKPVVKPAVPKASPPKKTAPAKNYPAQKKAETVSYNAEKAVKENKHPSEEKNPVGQKSSGQVLPPLKWDRNAAMQGIVYAEILGKPKALRHR